MIHIIWATARPEVFIRCHHNKWIATASQKDQIRTYVVVDHQQHAEFIRQSNVSDYYSSDKCSIAISKATTRGVAKPANQAAQSIESEDGDIIILASDDFEAPLNWDTWLLERAKEEDSKCLWVNDGFKPGGTVTIPILTHKCFKRLNKIIYHPSYNHEWSDAELYDILKELDLLYDLRSRDKIFQHKHWANGLRKQDGVDGECRKLHNKDRANYMLRKHMTIEQKLKI